MSSCTRYFVNCVFSLKISVFQLDWHLYFLNFSTIINRKVTTGASNALYSTRVAVAAQGLTFVLPPTAERNEWKDF